MYGQTQSEKFPPKLRTLICQVYSALKKSGEKQVMIHQIIDEITRDHPKLVAQEKERLFRDTIGAWARHILKIHFNSLPLHSAIASFGPC